MESEIKQSPHKSRNLFKITEKSLFTQYFIIILWIIGAYLIAFYLIYDSMKYELIHQGILPTNYDYLLIISTIITLLGFIILIVSKNQIKDDTK